MPDYAPASTNQPAPPGVLLLPFHQPSLRCHLVLARAMLADGRLRPLLLATDQRLLEQARAELPSEQVIPFLAGRQYPEPPPGLAQRLAGKLLPPAHGQALALRRFLQGCLAGARPILEGLKPLAVIGADDRKVGAVAAWWRLARDQGVFRLLVPFALTAGREDTFRARQAQPEYFLAQGGQTLLKRWAARCYPGQVYNSPGGPMLFFSPGQTLAMGSLGLLPADPWCWGGGGDCLVAVSGQEELEQLTKDGLNPARAVITGEPNHDDLFALSQGAAALRAELAQRYGLDQGRLNLIWTLPQLAEHKVMGWDEHWQEINFLAQALAQAPVNLLLSLHPKSDPGQYRFLEQRHGAHLLAEPLNRTLPAADLFVAAYSSTVRWAVMLGVPTLLVDFYDLDFKFLDHLGGVVKVTDRQALPAVLGRLCADQQYRASLIQAHRQDAPRLAPFDGRANRRIIELILSHARTGAGA